MSKGRHPATDTGTVVVHTIVVVSLVVLTLTGLRIASDDPNALWLRALDAVLPTEQLWFRHLIAGLALTAALSGYLYYIVRARLIGRVRLDRTRLKSLLQRGSPRWLTVNVIIYWGLMAALLTEIGTGAALFLQIDGPWLSVHLWTTFTLFALVIAHVAVHARIGGARHLARVLRPAPLVVSPPPPDLAELLAEQLSLRAAVACPGGAATSVASAHRAPVKRRTHPAAFATVCGILIVAAAVELESLTRPVLRIVAIRSSDAPRVDGDLSDPIWAKAPVAKVVTTQGGDFGGTGVSVVEVRAVHDGHYAYFAFVWTDPTRSLKHHPLVKTNSGWKVMRSSDGPEGESVYDEDKFSVLLTRPMFPLIGGAIHLGRAPLADRPQSSSGRGLHYMPDDSIADCWIWRASHGGPGGHIDNAHFGPPLTANARQYGGAERYTGGFSIDTARLPYRANYAAARSAGNVVEPLRLPRDLAANKVALGRISNSATISESEGARWWMTNAESISYTSAVDAAVPVGTIVPGVLVDDVLDVDDTSIRGVARWAAGRWTLEVVRRLDTDSSFDIPIETGTLMWVAAFDHAKTRHSRHLRPFRLEVE